MSVATGVTWGIVALSTGGVIVRPRQWPEWIWAVMGAALLLALGLLPLSSAMAAIAKGGDVYLFLAGMMLLSETARASGVFDWVAAAAVNHAGGSPARLFTLIYAAGVVVTTFLSNDATAVVMTPAVFAAARAAKADPLPHLFACALVANAASFVLPISNPANLVLYGGHMPPLGDWMHAFALPSIAAIVATYVMLRWSQRGRLNGACADRGAHVSLSRGGTVAVVGIAATAAVLLTASAFDVALGLPTALAGVATTLIVSAVQRQSVARRIRDISWGVLPLVAGLFVLVEALDRTGVIARVADALRQAATDPHRGAAIAGTLLAFASNFTNNLPAGLIASSAVAQAAPPRVVVDALLIGVDLGPNLTITGSLATILWLQAIRREGEDVTFLAFLRVGVVVMVPALALSLASLLAVR